MTKSTITRERIEQYANDPRMCNINDEIRELARMALAAMDSEPVAEVVSIYGDHEAFGEREIIPLVGIQQMPCGTKLYRHAQPAPVSYSDFEEFWSAYIHPLAQDDELKDFSWGIWNACVSNSQPAPVVPPECVAPVSTPSNLAYEAGWNACRAAMLSGGKS